MTGNDTGLALVSFVCRRRYSFAQSRHNCGKARVVLAGAVGDPDCAAAAAATASTAAAGAADAAVVAAAAAARSIPARICTSYAFVVAATARGDAALSTSSSTAVPTTRGDTILSASTSTAAPAERAADLPVVCFIQRCHSDCLHFRCCDKWQ